MSPECAPVMTAAFCGAGRAREDRAARHERSARPRRSAPTAARSYSACASWRIVPPARRACAKSAGVDASPTERVSICAGIDAQRRTPARTESRASRARRGRRDRPTDPPRRSRARARRASASSSEQPVASMRDSTALVVPFRIATMRVMPIAGEAVADGAHDRHRAADRRLEAQLPSLARGERRAAPAPCARDHLLVRGDDRLAGEQRRANPVGGRLDAADRLRRRRRRRWSARRRCASSRRCGVERPASASRFAGGAAVEDVRELESADGDRTPVRRRATAEPTVPKPRRATRQRDGAAAGGVKRIDAHRLSPSSPLRDAGIAAGAEGRNWHLNRDRMASRGCRGVAGPVPQPLLIKKSVFSCPADYSRRSLAECKSTYAHRLIRYSDGAGSTSASS